MNVAGFVISLDRAAERREHTEWIVANCPVPCERISAVDGASLSQDEVDQIYRRQIHKPRYPHTLKRGEIGCFLSHRRVWQTIVDRKVDAAMIFEDDVVFDRHDLAAAIDFTCRVSAPLDYVQFQVRNVATHAPIVAESGGLALRKPRCVPLRTTAQWVTRGAAERLLEKTAVMDRPVDTLLQMTWLTGVPVKVLTPCVVHEISQQIGGSTLGGVRRPWHEKIRREVLRSFYRAQIRSRSKHVA